MPSYISDSTRELWIKCHFSCGLSAILDLISLSAIGLNIDYLLYGPKVKISELAPFENIYLNTYECSQFHNNITRYKSKNNV